MNSGKQLSRKKKAQKFFAETERERERENHIQTRMFVATEMIQETEKLSIKTFGMSGTENNGFIELYG